MEVIQRSVTTSNIYDIIEFSKDYLQIQASIPYPNFELDIQISIEDMDYTSNFKGILVRMFNELMIE
jgi:hypothetical protein